VVTDPRERPSVLVEPDRLVDLGRGQAWLLCAVIAHNLLRGATLRRQIVNVAARLAHRAHGIDLHLPEHWPRAGH